MAIVHHQIIVNVNQDILIQYVLLICVLEIIIIIKQFVQDLEVVIHQIIVHAQIIIMDLIVHFIIVLIKFLIHQMFAQVMVIAL
jgi:hypothetical protein